MAIKLDLHTHSAASWDGGISVQSYERALRDGILDCIAITDHNRIDKALEIQSKIGKDKIIIGEEISTKQGDIIGLFLVKSIEPGMEVADAIEHIKDQGGLVYIPHPFETVRHGITEDTLKSIIESVDIIETTNGRAFFQNRSAEAHAWAVEHGVIAAASSDAHRGGALGKTYTELKSMPTKETLLTLLKSGKPHYRRPSISDLIAPKLNKAARLLKRHKVSYK